MADPFAGRGGFVDPAAMALAFNPQWGVDPSGVAGSGFGNLASGVAPSRGADIGRVGRVLQQNKKKNFVKRILDPSKFPTLKRDDLGPGVVSTHLMSWTQLEDGSKKNIVYPNIVQDEKTGELKRLQPQEAVQHALKTGEFIEMPTPEEAHWFSINYKLGSKLGGV